MSGAYSHMKRKTESAFRELGGVLLAGKLEGLSIYLGLSGGELATPRVEVRCDTATPEIIGETVTGNWFCDLTVALVTHYEDTPRVQHGEWLGCLEDLLMDDEIVDQLNNLETVTAYRAYRWLPGIATDEVDGDLYRSTITGTVYAAADPTLEGG